MRSVLRVVSDAMLDLGKTLRAISAEIPAFLAVCAVIGVGAFDAA